jgi:DNA invertase Pin-like site-specific DNA recombinase
VKLAFVLCPVAVELSRPENRGSEAVAGRSQKEIRMSEVIRAVLYFRMSTNDQENSIERQRSQVLPYAKRQSYQIVGEYIDEGIPGDEVDRRKDFKRLLGDAEAGQFDCILCDDRDRFGRFDSIDHGYYVKPLRDRGIWLETVAQGKLDWNSFAGRISDTVQQEGKQMETQAISRRVLSGFASLARQGRFLGSPIPYAYRLHVETDARGHRIPGTSKLVFGDAREVEAVRLMFRLYGIEGYSIEGICEELYRRGIPSPRGRARWCKQSVAHVLANRRYVGDMLWNEGSKAKYSELTNGQLRQYGRRAKQLRWHEPEDFIVTPNAHEPIIERELFEKVQWRLGVNRLQANPAAPEDRPRRRRKPSPIKRRPSRKRNPYRLSGLLVCGHCGARMQANIAPDGHIRYRCSTRINYGPGVCAAGGSIKESFVLERLLAYIDKHILNPDGLAELHEQRRAEMKRLKKEQPKQLEALRRRESELTQQIDGLTSKLGTLATFAEGSMMRHYHESIDKWKVQRGAVQKEIADTLRPPKLADLDEAVRHVGNYMTQLRELLDKGEPKRLRLLLAELVDRIALKFKTHQCAKRPRSKFDSGVIYVRSNMSVVTSKTQGRL